MAKSSISFATGKVAPTRPKRPYGDFPLFPHATKRWAKKIRGKFHYFGRWDKSPDGDWQAALEHYQQQRDDLHAGRQPREAGHGMVLRDVINHFLTAKEMLVGSGDIVTRTFRDYYDVCGRILRFFGHPRLVDDITAEDFAAFRANLSKTRGPVALANDIARVRILFKWGFDSGLVDKPMRYGQSFQKPTKATLRKSRAARGPRMFSAEDIRRMLQAASPPLRAMMLLGCNCGFGNQDCAMLPKAAVELGRGWVDYPRPKTGIQRRCPLWPETVEAIKVAIATRPQPKDAGAAGLVFITSRGKAWAKDKDDNPISKETAKILKKLGIHRPGLNFYALRHVFQTVGEGSRDGSAVAAIMGHAPSQNDMGATYREHIPDDRLLAVSEHVRRWLWPLKGKRKAR